MWSCSQLLQEEDFVTHTFNRSLLDSFDVGTILKEINDTIEQLANYQGVSLELVQALQSRLEHRAAFLSTVEVADSRTATNVKDMWKSLQELTSQVQSSARLGKPVPDSFSVKVQRKLASTVPPRPVIEVAQDAAFSHLEQICKDAAVAIDVLTYSDSQSLLVSLLHIRLSFLFLPFYRPLCSYFNQGNLSHQCTSEHFFSTIYSLI